LVSVLSEPAPIHGRPFQLDRPFYAPLLYCFSIVAATANLIGFVCNHTQKGKKTKYVNGWSHGLPNPAKELTPKTSNRFMMFTFTILTKPDCIMASLGIPKRTIKTLVVPPLFAILYFFHRFPLPAEIITTYNRPYGHNRFLPVRDKHNRRRQKVACPCMTGH
jgi:hypothetical protein